MPVNKANLFIVGAMKAGTTSFSNSIAQHPNIYFSPIKEPNYFVNNLPKTIYTPSRFFSLEEYFNKEFPNPLHIAHIENKAQYDKLFSTSLPDKKYFVDGSASYLHATESAQKIFSYNPNAKIIILIRNGLERALSHYKMDMALGRITTSFEKKLKEDWNAYQTGVLSNWSYLGMGLYAENICRYQKFFKRNVLIINFEDLINKEEIVFKKVFNFLELDYFRVKFSRINQSANIRFKKGLSFFYKTGMKDVFSKIFPLKVRHAAFNLLKRRSSADFEIATDFKNELLCLFEDDVVKIKEGC